YTSEAINVVLLPDGPTALPLEILSQLGHIPQLGTCQPLGAPACFNRLIAYDDAEIAIFLESGSIVTAGWLERLLEALRSDAGYGLAGPSTNLAWNEQHLQDAPSAEAEDQEVEAYATQVAHRYHDTCRSLEPLHSLNDFCYTVKREVITAIGWADE